jgi:hypothetical protein
MRQADKGGRMLKSTIAAFRTHYAHPIAGFTRRLPVVIAGVVGGLLALAAAFNQVEPWAAFESARWFRGMVLPFVLGGLAGMMGAFAFERLDPAREGAQSLRRESAAHGDERLTPAAPHTA